jgi:hypothetical protein
MDSQDCRSVYLTNLDGLCETRSDETFPCEQEGSALNVADAPSTSISALSFRAPHQPHRSGIGLSPPSNPCVGRTCRSWFLRRAAVSFVGPTDAAATVSRISRDIVEVGFSSDVLSVMVTASRAFPSPRLGLSHFEAGEGGLIQRLRTFILEPRPSPMLNCLKGVRRHSDGPMSRRGEMSP